MCTYPLAKAMLNQSDSLNLIHSPRKPLKKEKSPKMGKSLIMVGLRVVLALVECMTNRAGVFQREYPQAHTFLGTNLHFIPLLAKKR